MIKKLMDIASLTFSKKRVLCNETEEIKERINNVVIERNYHIMLPSAVIVILITVMFMISDITTGFYARNFPYSILNMITECLHLSAGTFFILSLIDKKVKNNDLKRKRLFSLIYLFAASVGFSLYSLSDALHDVTTSTHYFALMLLVVMPVLSNAEFIVYYIVIYAMPSIICNIIRGKFDALGFAIYMCAYILHLLLRVNFIRSELNRMKFEDINKALEASSMTDPLTQIGNRGKFYKVFSENSARWAEEGYEMCLVMVDIDKFKNYNDTYSHLKGDECLVSVASVISNVIEGEKSTENLLIRFGGEEFLFVLAGKSTEKSLMRIYPQIRAGIRELALKSGKGVEEPYVTVSLGAHIFRYSTDAVVETELKKADMQLYMVKENGRNGLGYNCRIYRD